MRTSLFLILLLPLSLFAKTSDVNIFFEQGIPFDGACNSLKQDDNYKITESMRVELTKRISEFERNWASKGSELVHTMTTIVKKPYPRKEETLTLTLCQWFSPMSNPFILRVREYLKATSIANPNGPTDLKPDAYFVGQVFHEIIHRYIDNYFTDIDQPEKSAMIRSHSTEAESVLVHLHHLSIQKAVYVKLGRTSELDTIIDLDSKIRGGMYKRAWEVVNADGYQKYIDELLKYQR